ncbi:hypothetical protein [Pseudomonas syringae]|uniref:Lipoprotein n=1 Tax=Pseudomonas syringae pv. actinidifoliorum ICMP 18803 TaxID=1194400 RepID=A0AAT9SG83_PSESX|nr:hypothetical protein [Pseudomonas syringae]EPM50391.1 hypothetical protein A246_05489 [Pseudomonas syringae pv. actinidiae ICMP 19098]EPM66528.1 hypothetical protein A249_40447 [Pseudomonas syringae pv. actinidiae ICMP 18804]EPN20612.1 hypothetical protein A248_05810 [Pseudomonas syringae pv. actinidiae ICMP 19100]EPN28290.1 hypothetical protein A247_05746 [Pseudomonas syringae pv. actinidiae ICMP 19099]EPN36476.1 hypothetical protein A243_05921 [Pseudomonas syringae pv. actinidiae ICMP 188
MAILMQLTLGGYTQYLYVKPETEQGKHCVKELDAKVSQYEQRTQDAMRSQQASYDFQMIGYRACTQQTLLPQPCGSEHVDPSAAQSRICWQDYKES